jgi:hypothetical protein
MFLADAVAAYVESLSERELDVPFMAMLRHEGFANVHLTHGAYEFGRDVVGQRVEDGQIVQYCFQSKAGDLGARAWREVNLQVHAMRVVNVAHPGFRPDLPRRLVVVTNGRLKGGAPIEFQAENEYLKRRGEGPVLLWDIDELAPMFERVLSDGVAARDRSRTLEMLGRLGAGTAERGDVRTYTRAWFALGLPVKERWAHALTAAMLAREAFANGREDLAVQIALLLLRASVEAQRLGKRQRLALVGVAHGIFIEYAGSSFQLFRDQDPLALTMRDKDGPYGFVLHPVRVHRLMEVVALYGLYESLLGDRNGRADAADFIEALCSATPAVGHPVSDEWAYSILCAGLLLWRTGRSQALRQLLETTAVWLLDRVEAGRGLAESGTSPADAVRQLLGPAYLGMRVQPRGDSYGFTVVLDLAWLAGEHELYEDVLNDMDAVRAMACTVIGQPPDDVHLVARVEYVHASDVPSGGFPAQHHDLAEWGNAFASSPTSVFDAVASWATLRDRHAPHILAQVGPVRP